MKMGMDTHSALWPPPPMGLLKDPADADDPAVIVLDDDEPVPDEDRRVLVCRTCRTRITRRDLGMSVDGQHRHVFFNPHGLVFEVGCFASARNVVPAGPRIDEYTWFPGYAWQAVGCTGCMSHLGWRYTGGEGGFYGLILTMLTEHSEGTR